MPEDPLPDDVGAAPSDDATGTVDDGHVLERSRLLLALSEALAETIDVADVADAVSRVSVAELGCQRTGLWLRQTDLPRDQARPGDAAPDPDLLCWTRADDGGWWQATAYDRVAIDDSTPVGLAALRHESCFLDSRRAQNDLYPHLAHPRQEGERRAFLPLLSRGRLFGAIGLVWERPGPFTKEQRATVAALASYASQALERAALRQERLDALTTLQRSLLPVLPDSDGAQLASRYLPASAVHQVGGDWYDALAPRPGSLDVTVGDVMGHDVSAAAAMGQVRTALRVLSATSDDTPATQVAQLDRTLAELDVAAMATLVHCRITRGPEGSGTWDVAWTNAGHPPPLVLLPDGEVRWLERPTDVLVGFSACAERNDHRTALPEGSTILLYTDGLVERRGESLTRGLDRLAESLARRGGAPLEALLDDLLADMVAEEQDDDVAVLGVRLAETPAHG